MFLEVVCGIRDGRDYGVCEKEYVKVRDWKPLIEGHRARGAPEEFLKTLKEKNQWVYPRPKDPSVVKVQNVWDRIQFQWDITDEKVKFSVREHPMNNCIFRYWSRGLIPPLGVWIPVLKESGFSEKYIKGTIKRVTKHKKATLAAVQKKNRYQL